MLYKAWLLFYLVDYFCISKFTGKPVTFLGP
jgi:hypothetical protein